MYNQESNTSHRTKNMKQQLFIVSAIFTLLLNPHAYARSASGIGTVSNPTDWLRGYIENRIRHVIQPNPTPGRLGFDYKKFSESFAERKLSYALTINPDGSIADLKLHQSSGSQELDQNCRLFIEKAAPFRLPGIKAPNQFLIEFPSIKAVKDLTI